MARELFPIRPYKVLNESRLFIFLDGVLEFLASS